jgi:hypothetical protein
MRAMVGRRGPGLSGQLLAVGPVELYTLARPVGWVGGDRSRKRNLINGSAVGIACQIAK